MGYSVKTDKADAETLALFGEKVQPKRTFFMDEKDEELRELVRARDVLIENIRQYKNRLDVPYVSEIVNKKYADIIDNLEQKLKEINHQINEFMVRDQEYAEKRGRLVTMKGFAATRATSLLAHCPELGILSRQEVGTLSGTCPNTKARGTAYMQEHIWGGRPELRRVLYMPALVAIRLDPEMYALYERLISKGKSPKIALTAVMRKLLIRANSILKRRVNYEIRGTLPPKVKKAA